MKINVSEDEIILMIRKQNEEAIRLLFSIYETKMRFEANKFAKKYKLSGLNSDDFFQEISIHFLDVIKSYNFYSGKLYSYWLLLAQRQFAKKYKVDIEKDGYVISGSDFEAVKYYSNNLTSNDNIYYFKTEYDSALTKLKLKKKSGDKFVICIKLWSQGYTYNDIANILNMSPAKVNYYISRGLQFLKETLNKKK